MIRFVVVLAATTPAASFKLPWSRSAPKSGGYQLGDISKAVYENYKNQKDGKATTPAVSDAYDAGYAGTSELARQMPKAEFKYCPPKEMTGVEVDITRACATFSNQMYSVTDPSNPRTEFDLSTGDFECTVVLKDLDHETPYGSSEATNPPFAAAITGETMICAWRGSTTIMDWAIDAGLAPAHSESWYAAAPQLRTHGGFTSMVESDTVWKSKFNGTSDVTKHTADLCALIEKHGVTRLIFTGHSLGGGAAQMGNIVVSGRMRNPASPWAAYKDKLEVRSVAFAGPGAIVQDVLELDAATQSFANDVASRSVNLIADQDIVSRFTTDLDFVDAYLDDVLPALAEERVPLPKLLFYVVDAKGKIDGLYEKGKDAEPVQALTKVAGTFRHACPLVMYEDDQSEPVLLAPWTDASLLRSYEYQKLKRGEDPIQRALEQHSLTKDGLAYNND